MSKLKKVVCLLEDVEGLIHTFHIDGLDSNERRFAAYREKNRESGSVEAELLDAEDSWLIKCLLEKIFSGDNKRAN